MRIWQTWKSEEDAINAHKTFGSNLLLRDSNNKQRIERVLKEIQHNTRVLDVGCNDGSFGEFLINGYNCVVYGVDVSYSCEKSAKDKGIKFSLCPAENLPYDDNFFDIVLAMETLEHIWDVTRVLTETKRVLKVGGCLVGTVPHPQYEKSEDEDFHCNYFDVEGWRKKISEVFGNAYLEDVPGMVYPLQNLFFRAVKE